MSPPGSLEVGAIVTGLGGGLALFLFGMRQMTEALKTVAGGRMKNVLARLTANRFTAALAGTIITGVIQSSSVTTVLVVGFVSSGLLTLAQSIGVIIGANVGTTITAQIIAFKVSQYGLLLIALGFATEISARREHTRQWGTAIMGLGLIFFGMELMGGATGPLRSWPPFIDAMGNMSHPLLAVLAGAVFTAIVQSSSATTGIVIVLASQGLISLESGIGLIFGANVGTCVTAVISAIGRPREAVQAAWVHIVFNAGGVLLWMFFIPPFAELVRSLSSSSAELDGMARLAAETPRQIANAHTLFNVGNALLFIGFTGPLAKLVDRIVPRRPEPEGVKPLYLNELSLEQPALGLDHVRRELGHMGAVAEGMLGRSLHVVTTGTRSEVSALAREDDDVDRLHGAVITYLGKLSQTNLVDPQPKFLSGYIGIANYLENLCDVIDENLLDTATKRLRLGIAASPSTVEVLQPIHDKVCKAFQQMLEGLRAGDLEAAGKAIASKAKVNRLASRATGHLAKRLVASEPHRLAAFQIETDIIEDLKRINTLTRRIARVLIELEGTPDEETNSGP